MQGQTRDSVFIPFGAQLLIKDKGSTGSVQSVLTLSSEEQESRTIVGRLSLFEQRWFRSNLGKLYENDIRNG